MAVVRFISDYHFGHEWIAKNRGFQDAFYMNEHIVKEHNKIVHKKDLTYILGDITMETEKWYFYLDQMNGRKKVILGNHDDPIHVVELLKYVESVGSMIKYKGCFITHCPIHPQELEYRVSKNIHGHLHEYNVVKEIIPDRRDTNKGTKDDRYINVSCEQVNYKPKTLLELGIKR
tara:strand:- start:2460 stop:2984 length:525 start_codon:yes stop_codon:yes gene_type:complete